MKLSRKDATYKTTELKSSDSGNNPAQPQTLPPPPPPSQTPTQFHNSRSTLASLELSFFARFSEFLQYTQYTQRGARYLIGPGTTGAPAHPIVVVSPDPSPPETIEWLSSTGKPALPRQSALNKLLSGHKDMIPLKPPHKQWSSRLVITERVEIEKFPPFGVRRVSVLLYA